MTTNNLAHSKNLIIFAFESIQNNHYYYIIALTHYSL